MTKTARKRALILTAISLERIEVEKHLTETRTVNSQSGYLITVGTFPVDGVIWDVYVGETGPGNPEAAVAASWLGAEYKPDIAIFVGVAGGRKDVVLGDVAVADFVYYYEYGKDGKKVFCRPRMHQPSNLLLERAKRESTKDGWRDRIKLSGIASPTVYVKPIAAGEKVVGKDSGTAKKLATTYGDAIACSMEDFGFLEAWKNKRKVHAIVVRGISDMLEKTPDGDKIEQPIAAAVASAFAFELLFQYSISLLPVDNKGKQGECASAKTSQDKEIVNSKLLETIAKASRRMLHWPNALLDGTWLERSELAIVMKKIRELPQSTSIVLGQPGTGKSALLSRIATEITEAKGICLAIKADLIPATVDSDEKLSQHLGFTQPVHELIRAAARTQRVVVIIDQIDALADLVDLKTGRLNVLLSLIEHLHECEGIHIVTSARTFEASHDARLSRLVGDRITMSLPDWMEVDEHLKRRHIDTASFNSDLKELLRLPEHLLLFSKLSVDSLSGEYANSIQQALMDAWWQQYVEANYATETVSKIAELISEREELWIPVSLMADHKVTLNKLIQSGVLLKDDSGKLISFRHQSLFEFARARSFLNSKTSLVDYVIQRQDALFVRPVLWTTLRYLRDTDQLRFQKEFSTLLSTPTLRFHVKSLLIEFLGCQKDPSVQEKAWLMPMIQIEDLRRIVLNAMAGSSGWFSEIEQSCLPSLMSEPNEVSSETLPVLTAAVNISTISVLGLVERVWLTQPQKDPLTFCVLQSVSEWDNQSVKIAHAIIRRSPLNDFFVETIIQKVSDQIPESAPALILARLQLEVDKLPSDEHVEFVSTCDAALDDYMKIAAQNMRNPRRKQLIRILDNQDNYVILDVAEKAPRKFVEAVFPWFAEMIEVVAHSESSTSTRYRDDGTHISGRTRRDELKEHSIFAALSLAMRMFAESAPDHFLDFVYLHGNKSLLAIQRLLAMGLTTIAASRPHQIVSYLVGDPRRLHLGTIWNEYEDSQNLLAAVAPSCDTSLLGQLETAILSYSPYIGNIGTDHRRKEAAQKCQLRLLESISGYLSKKVQRLVDAARVEINNVDLEEPRVEWLGSSAETHSSIAIDQILTELNSVKTIELPRGKSIRKDQHESKQLLVMAQRYPEKAAKRIEQLEPVVHEFEVERALEKLSYSAISKPSLVKLITDCYCRGFVTPDFVRSTCLVLGRIVNQEVLVPENLVAILEGFLASGDFRSSHSYESKETVGQSIIFGYHNEFIAGGNFPILYALAGVLLASSSPNNTRWFECLEAHLTRNENLNVWENICTHYLTRLFQSDPVRSEKFVSDLFEQYPSLFATRAGVVLASRVSTYMSENFLEFFLTRIQSSTWELAEQAFGEVLMLNCVNTSGENWASEKVRFLIKEENLSATHIKILIGMAYVTSRAWSELQLRSRATPFLLGLIAKDQEGIFAAVDSQLQWGRSLLQDQYTEHLLDLLIAEPKIIRGRVFQIFEQLEDLVFYCPDKVHKICEAIIKELASSLADYRMRSAWIAGTIVNIALSLQRLPEFRSKGLDLFEGLLRLGVPDAKAALGTIDRRTVTPIPWKPRRRRAHVKR